MIADVEESLFLRKENELKVSVEINGSFEELYITGLASKR